MAVASISFFEAFYASTKEWDRPDSFRKFSKHVVTLFSFCAFVYTFVLSLALHCSWSFDLVVAILVSRLATVLAYR